MIRGLRGGGGGRDGRGRPDRPAGFDLAFDLTVGGEGTLPPDPPAWWEACRVPGAARLASRDGGEAEGFVFYEMPWTPDARLIRLESPSERVRIQPMHGDVLDLTVLLPGEDGPRLARLGRLADGEPGSAPARESSPAEVRRHLRSHLVDAGLHGPEADALLACWDHLLDPDRPVAIWRLPEEVVNEAVPLSVNPGPSELRRIWLVATPLP